MTVGVLVLPEVMVGMIEASTVVLGREIVRRDRGRRVRIGRRDAHVAARGRLQVADARGERGKAMRRPAEAGRTSPPAALATRPAVWPSPRSGKGPELP